MAETDTLPIGEDLLADFHDKTRQHVERCMRLFLEIEMGDTDSMVLVKRELHTLKGLSAMFGFQDLSELCHRMEDYLGNSHDCVQDRFGVLLEACDFVAEYAEALGLGVEPPAVPETILSQLTDVPASWAKPGTQDVATSTDETAPAKAPAGDGEARNADDCAAKRFRFLIVDDTASCKLFANTLESHGRGDSASDAESAIKLFRTALEAGVPYHAALVELTTGGGEGHIIIKWFRCLEHAHGIYGPDGSKIIVFSTDNDPRQESRAFKAGCQAYVKKPANPSDWIDLLRRFKLIGKWPHRHTRKAPRFLAEVREIVMRNGPLLSQPAEVVDESFTGIGILVDEVSQLRPGRELDVDYKGAPMRATVRHISPERRDGRYQVGLEWKNTEPSCPSVN